MLVVCDDALFEELCWVSSKSYHVVDSFALMLWVNTWTLLVAYLTTLPMDIVRFGLLTAHICGHVIGFSLWRRNWMDSLSVYRKGSFEGNSFSFTCPLYCSSTCTQTTVIVKDFLLLLFVISIPSVLSTFTYMPTDYKWFWDGCDSRVCCTLVAS